METYNQIDTEPQNKRPVFLSVLCVLTFISTGLSILGLIFSLISGPRSAEQVELELAEGMKMVNELKAIDASYLADQIEKIVKMNEYANNVHYLMLSVNFVAIVLGLGGAILMWRGRKLGFHSYILYNIVTVLGVYVAAPASEVPTLVVILGVVFSTLFIFMYSRNLKWMR